MSQLGFHSLPGRRIENPTVLIELRGGTYVEGLDVFELALNVRPSCRSATVRDAEPAHFVSGQNVVTGFRLALT